MALLPWWKRRPEWTIEVDRADLATLLPRLIVRLAVWREYVEANEAGVRWRALFRTSDVLWRDIQRLDNGYMELAEQAGFEVVLRIVLLDGRDRPMRGSYGCEGTWSEWLGAAAWHWAQHERTHA